MNKASILLASPLFLFSATSSVAVFPRASWTETSPESQGMDSGKLQQAIHFSVHDYPERAACLKRHPFSQPAAFSQLVKRPYGRSGVMAFFIIVFFEYVELLYDIYGQDHFVISKRGKRRGVMKKYISI